MATWDKFSYREFSGPESPEGLEGQAVHWVTSGVTPRTTTRAAGCKDTPS